MEAWPAATSPSPLSGALGSHEEGGKPVVPTNDSTGNESFYSSLDCLSYHILDVRYRPSEVVPSTSFPPSVASTPTWYILSSPNIRELPVITFGKQRVRARKDGRMGIHDRCQHPQFVCKDFEWMPCVPRRSESRAILWWTPAMDDAPIVQGNSLAYEIRVLRTGRINQLKVAIEESKTIAFSTFAEHPAATLLPLLTAHCDDCLERLSAFGLLFRDLLSTVADLQRACLDILAITSFINVFHPRLQQRHALDDKPYPVDATIMGGITNSYSTMQKYVRMGIPMTLVRPLFAFSPELLKIFDGGERTKLVKDRRIVEDDYEESGVSWPFEAVWDSLHCTAMHVTMQKIGFRVVDESASSRLGWERITGTSQSQSTTLVVAALPPGSRVPLDIATTPPTSKKLLHVLLDNAKAPVDPNAEAPPQILLWTTAISLIDKSHPPVLPADSPYRSYRLPPPDLLLRPKTRYGRALYQATWLASRTVHLANILEGAVNGPITQQHWRNHLQSLSMFLHTDDEPQIDGTRHNSTDPPPSIPSSLSRFRQTQPPSARRAASQPPLALAATSMSSTRAPAASASRAQKRRFESVAPSAGAPAKKPKPNKKTSPYMETLSIRDQPLDRVCWIETAALLGTPAELEASLTPQIGAEIIYELQEDCFRLDLLALDQVRAPLKWPSPSSPHAQGIRLQRRNAIREVFPSKSGPSRVLDGFLITEIPNVDRGLAAYDYYGRYLAICSLRTLMLDWEGCPDSVRNASTASQEQVALELEAEVVAHYCQTFFDTFGRIPVPPPRLPHLSTSRSGPRSLAASALGQSST